MDIKEYRLKVQQKIEQFEIEEKWDQDVEDDPTSKTLMPNDVDYLNKKFSSKIKTRFANHMAQTFFEKLIKKNQFIIKEVKGIENFLAVRDRGTIITSNHFSPGENYAVWRAIRKQMREDKRPLYRVIKEGNYTNPPKPFGLFMRHCNTLPLSSNMDTMKNFMKALSTLLLRGEKILIYPEQAMWWNYKKPRPLKPGAFRFAVKNKAPVLPFFITMEDSKYKDENDEPVQAYTVHILKPLFVDEKLSDKENIENMKNKNYEMWKEVYENTYKIPLTYKTKKESEWCYFI